MSQSNIRVAVRSRPLTEAAKEKWAPGLEIKGSRILLGSKAYDADLVFDPNVSQAMVFEECIPIIESVKLGRNGTIMVYGQTGTGKTHTMLGDSSDNSGVAFLAIEYLLAYVRDRVALGEPSSLSLSMLEIYNERMTDMFDTTPNPKEVMLSNGFPVGNQRRLVTTVDEGVEIVRRALERRHVSPTAMNDRSSRSHVIVVLEHEWRNAEKPAAEMASLYLVDLAGSECIKKSQATGRAAAEAGSINKSLLALRNVVSALTSSAAAATSASTGGGGAPSSTGSASTPGSVTSAIPRSHVPYRDSKLTQLLQDSIGGTARTMLIACISPVPRDMEETRSTLEYATKARRIRNNGTDEKERLLARVRSLEWQLQTQYIKNGGFVQVSKDEYNAQQQQIVDLQQTLQGVTVNLQQLSSQQHIHSYANEELKRARQQAEADRDAMLRFLHDQSRKLELLLDGIRQRFADGCHRVHQLHVALPRQRVDETFGVIHSEFSAPPALPFPSSDPPPASLAGCLQEPMQDVKALFDRLNLLNEALPRELFSFVEQFLQSHQRSLVTTALETSNVVDELAQWVLARSVDIKQKMGALQGEFQKGAQVIAEKFEAFEVPKLEVNAAVPMLQRACAASVEASRSRIDEALDGDLSKVQLVAKETSDMSLSATEQLRLFREAMIAASPMPFPSSTTATADGADVPLQQLPLWTPQAIQAQFYHHTRQQATSPTTLLPPPSQSGGATSPRSAVLSAAAMANNNRRSLASRTTNTATGASVGPCSGSTPTRKRARSSSDVSGAVREVPPSSTAAAANPSEGRRPLSRFP